MSDFQTRLYARTKTLLNAHHLLFAVVCSVAVITGGTFLGWYNNKVVPISTNPVAHYVLESHRTLSFLSNWDGPDYIGIATHGYQKIDQASFFPLYPLLIHLVNLVLNSPLYSALAISWLSLIGAIYFYTQIAKKLFNISDNTESIRALLYFVLFPTGVFLIATYTESLFSFLALAAIYMAMNNKYLLAGLLSMFACATHLDGIFVVVLVCLMLAEQKLKLSKIAVAALTGILGLVAYSAYLLNKFNSPLAFVLSQKSHGWLNDRYLEITTEINLLNIAFLVLIIVTAIYWWKRKRSLAIYNLLFLLIPLVGNQLGGFNRYMLMDFPLQLMAYSYLRKKPILYSLSLCLIGIIWAYSVMQYAGGYTGS